MSTRSRAAREGDPGRSAATDATGEVPPLETVIAARVREYRVAAGLNAAELAAKSGISRAMISRIETATTSASLSTIERLADALAVPVTALFRGVDTEREAAFTPAGQGSVTARSGTRLGHEYRQLGLLKGIDGAIDPTLVTLTESSAVFPLFQHPGTEFFYMLEGVMVYAHGSHSYTLRPGDSLLIDGEAPHGPQELIEVPIRFLAIGQLHAR
ncbi:XRE family transcriptional regulator [Homoserinibacter sp. GY 40078]|uniref:helix-turn-helix domain-containing protein n=1 Tax=Homoserinibacter sp. GY 40078 TaxID=2603275 RepID=UPI0011C9DC88|nr:XRE family transcriptional regulator [Homoserinibacter sp. GY 40078]TXK18740.1 helix-turn-helix transcriptional regulator [Homoserinibacter sp. GY 40078]